jgi:hypothetical protein
MSPHGRWDGLPADTVVCVSALFSGCTLGWVLQILVGGSRCSRVAGVGHCVAVSVGAATAVVVVAAAGRLV